MQASSWAGSLTAFFTLMTAIVVTIGALVARQTSKKVDTVHKIVNQQRTDMQNYNRALIKALRAHDIEVPDDQSVTGE